MKNEPVTPSPDDPRRIRHHQIQHPPQVLQAHTVQPIPMIRSFHLSLYLFVVTLSASAFAEPQKPQLTPQSRFEVTGDWRGGSTPGHAAGRGTLYSSSPNATATWLPAIRSVCPVRLSFWICPHPKNTPAARVEFGRSGGKIDINEGHWPNTINASLHQDGLPSQSKAWRAPVDLSKDFHTYACLWSETEVIYYWDGREIDRKPNTQAQRPGPVIFSTAVFPWAGSITDALHETSMDVDWVRVWRKK
jgi:hypothetical protein